MGKTRFIILAIVACLGFVGCSDTSSGSDEDLFESYFPIGVYLEKDEWKNGEEMILRVYSPTIEELPKHYEYIESVEYFIDGKSIGKSNETPFSIIHVLNLAIGEHEISFDLNLNKENVAWETKKISFTIIE